MCYQFIYYPSPNFFIKHLDIDKNHIVRYIRAVAAAWWGHLGEVGEGLDMGYGRSTHRACGRILCKNRQYNIHITAQIYFLHIGSHQKANIFSYVVVQCKSKMAASLLAGVASVWIRQNTSLIYCKHCCPTLSINNFVSIANTINYFVLVFPILLWYMRYVRAYYLYKDTLLASTRPRREQDHTDGRSGGNDKNWL